MAKIIPEFITRLFRRKGGEPVPPGRGTPSAVTLRAMPDDEPEEQEWQRRLREMREHIAKHQAKHEGQTQWLN